MIEALQKSSKLDLDDLRYEDHSKINFQDVLEKEKHWLCISCQRKIKVEEIFCEHC